MPLHNINGRKVRTTHEFPPIPSRQFDWSAVDVDSYDEEEGFAIGFGPTESAAIADLLEEIEGRRV